MSATGRCRGCGRDFDPERRGYYAPHTWVALPGPVEGMWPAVYDALLCRTCQARVRRGALDPAQLSSQAPRDAAEAMVAAVLCERHQQASPTRQPCAACVQDARAALDSPTDVAPTGAPAMSCKVGRPG